MRAHLSVGPVEQGIPLPGYGRTSDRARIFAALSELNAGESRLFDAVPQWTTRQLQNRICAAWSDLPGTFTSTQEAAGVRVWRLT
jgi:uncharacterized protein (DUF2249 family)